MRTVPAVITLITTTALVFGFLPNAAWAEDDKAAASSKKKAVKGTDSDGDGDLDRPDTVSASSTARALKKRVEDLSKRTETTRTFANADGSLTDEQFGGVVRVQSEDDGTWKNVDYDLEQRADGSWAPKVSPVDVSIDGGSSKEAARVTFEDGQSLAVTWPQPLPEPTIDGSIATYKLSEATDLVVTVTGRGVNTHIRLNSAPTEADPVFELGLRADDLDVKKSGTGLRMVDGDGKAVGATSNLVAWDAKTDESGSPLEVVPLASTLIEEATSKDVTNHALELKTPAGYLTDPNTQYPVTIDPDIGTLERLRDTYVRSGDTNHYYDNNFAVGKIAGETNQGEARAYLKFHTGGQIPGKQIISAEMRLWQYYSGTCAGRPMEIHPVTSAWNGNLTWSPQPAVTGAGSLTIMDNRGSSSSCGDGWTLANVTAMVQGWANGSIPNEGIRLTVPPANAGTAAYGRRFCSMDPSGNTLCNTYLHMPLLSVTYNNMPNTPSTVTIEPASSIGGGLVTTAKQPKLTTQISDPDGGAVSGLLRVTNTATGASFDEWTPSTASGGTVTKKLATVLADGTYSVVAFVHDGNQFGPPSSAMTFKVDTTPPQVPLLECSSAVSGQWYDTPPEEMIHCVSFSDLSAVEFVWTKNNQPQPVAKAINLQNVRTGVGLGNVKIPENGVFAISVQSRDAAGNLSVPAEFGFGVGNGATITPVDGERTSSTILTEGEGPAGATGARIEHRPAGSEASVPWAAATKVKKGSGLFDGWLNTVTPTDRNSVTTGKLLWDIAAEPGITKPSVRETRVCFIYAGVSKCTPSRDVTIVPAAFGSSFPTQNAGPGQVALFTGEFQVSESDVEVPAYSGTLSLGRSHRSYAGVTAPAQGVFGPGWVANLEGPGTGAGSFEVTDNTATEASITLTSPDGKSSTYVNEEYTASPQREGYYVGDAETATDNDFLEILPGSQKMVLIGQEGTETTWAHVGSGKWVIEKIDEPGVAGTTTYTHDAGGLVTGIYASTPTGVTCTDTTQTAGCRALRLTYTGIGAAKRLDQVDLRIWNPRPGADGKPGSNAAMATVPVHKYAYNAEGTLKEAWDPRLDNADGTSLKTKYEYAAIGTRAAVLTMATPPGQTPWQFDYGTSGADAGKLKTAKRKQVLPLTGDATWTVVYDAPLSGNGLPDVTAAATKTWGQDAAPVAGATVFAPNAPGTSDPTYGTISYWDVEGRTTNTATYGAGAWQIDSTAYDAKGNKIWSLDEGNRNTALASGGVTVAAAHNLSTQTVYNAEAPGIPAGSRVEQTTGPSRPVMLEDGTSVEGRSRTDTVYDDEAANESVPTPERPTIAADAPALNMPVEKRTATVTASGGLFDTKKTRYQYDPVVTGDGNGWDLKTPTRTMTRLGTRWSTEITRLDSEGKVVETRTPEGVAAVNGTANDARSSKTVYYTADNSASDVGCRAKPEWAGLECLTKTGDATIPVTRATGFDYLLNATRTEESATTSSGTMTRAWIAAYDAAGRKLTDKIDVTGATSGDQPTADTSYIYSPSTGVQTELTRGSVKQTTTYDGWGRVLTRTDGTGNVAITTYDMAGRIKTSNDGKGTYTYTYDGIDAAGKTERRGLLTKLDVGIGPGPSVFDVASSADGNAFLTKYPNGMKATTQFNAVGAKTALTYVDPAGTKIAAFTNILDAQSRVRVAGSTGSKQTYTYDDRARLTAVQDTTGGNCITRQYGFSLDSNRSTLATSGPGTGGACTTAGAAIVTSSFDDADRITAAGYTYDPLGRTHTVPAVHTDQPAGTGLTLNYHANDMVAKLAQAVSNGAGGTVAKSKTFVLDAADRISKTTDSTNGVDVRKNTNHYSNGGDSPSWIETETRPNASVAWATSWSRNVTGPDGDLAIIQPDSGGARIQLTNLQGDIVTTLDNGPFTGFAAWVETTEYGLAKSSALTLGQDYEWLGTKQRSTDAIGGLTLMGARLYNPTTGRFLSRDPVPGGNDNTYTYPVDPINMADLDGLAFTFKWTGWFGIAGTTRIISRSGKKWVGPTTKMQTFLVGQGVYRLRLRVKGYSVTTVGMQYATQLSNTYTIYHTTLWITIRGIKKRTWEVNGTLQSKIVDKGSVIAL